MVDYWNRCHGRHRENHEREIQEFWPLFVFHRSVLARFLGYKSMGWSFWGGNSRSLEESRLWGFGSRCSRWFGILSASHHIAKCRSCRRFDTWKFWSWELFWVDSVTSNFSQETEEWSGRFEKVFSTSFYHFFILPRSLSINLLRRYHQDNKIC